jgi:hypothetical protein
MTEAEARAAGRRSRQERELLAERTARRIPQYGLAAGIILALTILPVLGN